MTRPTNTAERRTQIARGLLHVMATTGYERASIGDIAKVAELAPGLVHYHFDNKLEILLAAIDVLAEEYDERLRRHLAAAKTSPIAQLQAYVDAHLHAGAEADPAALACWIDISGEALRHASVRDAFARALGSATGRLVAILERGAAEKVFACKEPKATAAAIQATIQGYFVLGAAARELVPRGSAARSTMAMCRGLLGLPPAPLPRRKKAEA